VKLYCDYLSFFLRSNRWRRGDGEQNAFLFLASKPPCRSVGAGCDCDPCPRLAIAEPACLCGGGCDGGCCRRHNHTSTFSFNRAWLIARQEKPSLTRRNPPAHVELRFGSGAATGPSTRSGPWDEYRRRAPLARLRAPRVHPLRAAPAPRPAPLARRAISVKDPPNSNYIFISL